MVGNDPFEDGNYTKEPRVVKEKLPVEDDSGTNETKNQVMETVEPDLFSSFVGEEKKEEVEPAVSKDFVLTAEVIDNQLVVEDDDCTKNREGKLAEKSAI
ncbi:hypothetical protein EfmAA242_27350 [Enterococcus faecium]|nr:hypothetical protein EfmAA242_27350 [Enterococcus faecium]